MDIMDYLQQEHIEAGLVRQVESFRAAYPANDLARGRVTEPQYLYYGREVLSLALLALITGNNLLLTGPKATGKNVLASTLGWVLGLPVWNMSFHVNTDSQSLIGQDTFRHNEVTFRPGPVWEVSHHGGLGIFDEINMARNEAVSVLHSILDHRRIIDVPGYGIKQIHPGARFIATMNHGYAGTREINEALASRFLILAMPAITDSNLKRMLNREYPSLKAKYRDALAQLFSDLQGKSLKGEITTRPLDLRGLLSAVGLARAGCNMADALNMGLTNKSFDDFEQTLVKDAIALYFDRSGNSANLFED